MVATDLIYDTSIALIRSNKIIMTILLDVTVGCSAIQLELCHAPRTL